MSIQTRTNGQKPLFSLDHIGYVRRGYLNSLEHLPVEQAGSTNLPLNSDTISWLQVTGLSTYSRDFGREVQAARYLMEDVLAGWRKSAAVVYFLILGKMDQISIYLGTISPGQHEPTPAQASVLATSLRSAYPGIELQASPTPVNLETELAAFRQSCTVVGTPTAKMSPEHLSIAQIERLIRGLYGNRWAYLSMAIPAADTEIEQFYNAILKELNLVTNADKNLGWQNQIAEGYLKSLALLLKKTDIGRMSGMWHTGVYLLSQDLPTLNYAKTLAKSIFSGELSQPDPVRVLDCSAQTAQVASFLPISTPAHPVPAGNISYPYQYLSLLNSQELSTFVHLPVEEMPGYFVREDARFDVAAHSIGDETCLSLGAILDRGRPMGLDYRIPSSQLDQHTLVAGVTGSGKTNTVFHLLRQLEEKRVPFLVIEPAKTEYRKLLHSDDLSERLQVFTLGDDTVAPFRLNPFEILPGVSAQTHIDILKSVFNASFVMYAPMPYVLERCIHEIYQDKGWDLVTGENERGLHPLAQPTLSDLYRKIDEVVNTLGYEMDITMNIRAALKTRINSLRIGGKGLMLDTRQSIPIHDLLQKPTVLELEAIGDDEEKAFVIGLLLMFMYEHYLTEGVAENRALQHVTVLEEAHRLLKNVPAVADTELSNTRGKAVETFCNVLAEIRAYGEGLVVVEQIPTKLATDILKNTSLKIMHRIVAADDREVMAATMNLDPDQVRRVGSLKVGDAAVFSQNDDKATLVNVPYRKLGAGTLSKNQENEKIHGFMGVRFDESNDQSQRFAKAKGFTRWKRTAEDIAEKPEFRQSISRYILSTVATAAALWQDFEPLVQTISQHSRPGNNSAEFVAYTLYCAISHFFDVQGREYGWSYKDVAALTDNFYGLTYKVLLTTYGRGNDRPEMNVGQIEAFQAKYLALCQTPRLPFASCAQVCPINECVYRHNVRPLLADTRLNRGWENAAQSGDNEIWRRTGDVCQRAALKIVSRSTSATEQRKAAACYAIQKSASHPDYDAVLQNKIITNLIRVLQDQLT